MMLELLLQYVCDKLFVYQLLATLATVTVINTSLFFRTRKKRHQLFKYYGIPGPEPSLLDGNLGLYLDRTKSYLIDQQFKDKYGKVFGIFMGDQAYMEVSDLEVLKAVFLERMSSFKNRQRFFLDTPLTSSILFAEHSRWKLMRKFMSPTFSSYVMRGEKSTQFIETSVSMMLEYIEQRLDAKTKTANVDMQNLMQAASLHLISSMAIDLAGVQVREGEPNVESLNMFLSTVDKGLVHQAVKFPFLRRILDFLAKHFEHNATMKRIHQGVQRRIDKSLKGRSHETADKPEQLMDIMIKLYKEGRISHEELIGNADAILIAGYETTSTTLAYIFWVLGKHSDVQERLRRELMAHGMESKYFEQVINEVMRLYPTVINFTARTATETVQIDSLTIPQGTTVVFNSWLVHRDPNYWPEPDKFDPERFREGAQIHPCAFAPFGMGERFCIGQHLAKLELKVIACDVLLRYRLSSKAPQQLELLTYADSLTKSSEKIMIEMEKL